MRERKKRVKKLPEIDINELFEANDDYISGNPEPLKRLLPYILRKKLYDEKIPVLFYVAKNIKTLEFLEKNGVNFYQKDKLGGATLLHILSSETEDDDAFSWVLKWYKAHEYVDATDDSGFTALSGAIKFGALARAKQFLEAGADIMSRAENGLTPLSQAIICLDGENKAIECLKLLTSKIKLSSENISELLEKAKRLNNLKIAKWIEENL